MIEKCFRCNGRGTILMPELPISTSPGSMQFMKSIDCFRCEGVGAVDCRLLTVRPIAKKKNKGKK